ncbi:thiamine/thiamine pyrophosphate ABC transporter permease [Orbaceae bacterium ac157xtp]
MATSRKSIKSFMPGIVVIVFIVATIFTALLSLWLFSFKQGEQNIVFDAYLQNVLLFTIKQALLSTFFSIIIAVLLAKALFHLRFKGKALFLKLLSVTFVMPSLVVVTGLLTVYGNSGWLNQIFKFLDFDYSFSIYGLNGILLGHIFLNFPFACRISFQTLHLIPYEQRQLSEQLGLNDWQIFKLLEVPALLKQLVPLSGLIFMLCFSSFAIVLALSGGPKYTTIEVAIYQSIRDFELNQAVILSFIQLFFCIAFMVILQRIIPKRSVLIMSNNQAYLPPISRYKKVIYSIIVLVSLFFICTPIIAILVDGIFYFSLTYLKPQLITALFTSISIAIISACFAMILSVILLFTNNKLQRYDYNKSSHLLMLFGSLILAVPSMVLSTGFFILFLGETDNFLLILSLIILSNSFIALPFILKNLAQPIADLYNKYYFLSESLDIKGLNYLKLIAFKGLKNEFNYCLALAAIMSLGDFGIIALFGGQNIVTLPYVLYEQVSHYQSHEAGFTALILCLLSFIFIYLFERSHYD